MPTTRLDITVQKGANFKRNLQARNSDGSVMSLVGYSAKMQIRASAEDPTVLLEASTSNGYITINGPGGIVMINVPANITAALDWTSGVWDLNVYTGPTDSFRAAEGFASLSLEVTQ